ncbi:uncharacterized protein LOC127288035 isoform X2 [Leptopilina boulardi]|uniref:uncharacterized protein LOC127288035 isoform X2 n=1 Tax=Leptopilina boulardi TaxID=63433 RepID=UPI0021F5021B|nr:uncharacterized protein LOC127288035 isoform X2 [Leptopilina boulardi]
MLIYEKKLLNNTSKILSKVEIIYKSILCFVANCLSSMTIDIGSKSALVNSVNKSTTFNTFFRRSYNLKIKILVTDIISGLIASAVLTMGNKYNYPYLYIPWLLNTLKGIALFQGPTLLRTAYKLISNAEVPAGSFLFITLLLFKEIFLWNDVFWNFKRCWNNYIHCKRNTISEKNINEKKEKRLPTVDALNDEINFKFGKVDDCQMPFENADELSKILCSNTGTNSSDYSLNVKYCSSMNENNHLVRSKFTDITG